MTGTELTERRREILFAIIEEYIRTAEPVGSKAICEKYMPGISSATVRNEMAALTEMGYIEQPHTSAGRIPSELGYRCYVNAMSQDGDISDMDERKVRRTLSGQVTELEKLLEAVSRQISEMTRLVTVTTMPCYSNNRIKRFDSSKWKNKQATQEAAIKIIQEVGLSEADLSRYPTEFSGGQRQRISIARGLIMNPELLICDEVVSALDVSIQGQIINLLQDLRQKHNLSYLFITHDLKVACYFSDVIGVMYRGILVEEAEASSLYKNAVHPYTKLLFEGIKDSNIEVKSTLQQENCCCFAHRCPYADEKCKNSIPQMREIAENHKVRCFHI